MNESIGVFAIGEAFGSFALMALVSVVVLFINRSRKENPTPYIAAGMICFLLAAMTAMSDRAAPHLSALYVTWLILLWRYKKESNKQASRLGRANAIWLGLVLVICVWSLVASGDRSVPALMASIGLFSIAVGALAKWVMLAPKRTG